MKAFSLPALNEAFGTAARAHEHDARFLIGETVADLTLAFVPGVKAVHVPNVLSADSGIGKREFEAREIMRTLVKKGRDFITHERLRTYSPGLPASRWHFDRSIFPGDTSVRFLFNVKGLGTEAAIGSGADLARECQGLSSFYDVTEQGLARAILHRWQMAERDVLAMNIPVCGILADDPEASMPLAETALIHRAPDATGTAEERLLKRFDCVRYGQLKIAYAPL